MPSVFEDIQNAAEQAEDPATLQPASRTRTIDLFAQASGAEPPPRAETPGALTELARGVGRGLVEIQALTTATGGAVVGALGDEEGAADLLALAASTSERGARDFPTQAPGRVEDIEDVDGFIRWAAARLGEQVPVIASIAATGGVGAIGTRLAAKGLLTNATRSTITRLSAAGGAGGAFAGATTLETGASAREQFEATGELRPELAFAAGAAKGSLELLVPLAIARRFGLSPTLAGSLSARVERALDRAGVLGVTFGAAVTEGVTETAQEAIDIAVRGFVDENFDVLGPEAGSRLLNAAATGTLVGGGVGGIVGAFSRQGAAEFQPEVPVDPLDVQRRIGQSGLQLELFPGENLGIEQPGVETISAKSRRAELLTGSSRFGLEIIQGPVDVSPEQVGLFDSSVFVNTIARREADAVEEELFTVSARAVPQGVEPVSPRQGSLTREEAFEEIARQGAQNVTVARVDSAGRVIEKVDVANIQPTRFSAQTTRLQRGQDTPARSMLFSIEPANFRAVEGRRVSVDLETLPSDAISGLLDSIPERERAILIQDPNAEVESVQILNEEARSFLSEALANQSGAEISRLVLTDQIRIEPAAGADFITLRPLNSNEIREEPLFPQERTSRVAAFRGNALSFVREQLEGSRVHGTNVDFDLDIIQPGTVTPINNGGETGALNDISELYRDLLKRMGIEDQRIIVTSQDFGRGVASGRYAYAAQGTHMVWVDASQGAEQRLTSAAHEFGHLLMAIEFHRLGSAGQERIYNAFLRSTRASLSLTPLEAAIQQFSPTRLLGQNVREGAQGFETFDQFLDQGLDLSSWWSFDEWIAEQTARWAVTSRQALTSTDKFFKRTAKRILTALRRIFGKRVRDFAAEPEIQRWLDALVKRRETEGTQPITPAVMADSSAQSVEENSSFLTAMSPAEVPPAQGASVEPKNEINKSKLRDRTVRNATEGDVSLGEVKAELDKYNFIMKWGWNVLQLADVNKHIRGLQRYVEFTDQWYNLKMRWAVRANQRLQEWNALGKTQATRLNSFIFDIAEMNYLNEGDALRWPNANELVELVRKHKINEDAQDVYQRIMQDFQDVLTQVQETLNNEARRTIEDPDLLQREFARIALEMNNMRKQPYFPFARFGDFSITVREKNKIVFFSQYESKRARDRALKAVRAEFPTANIELSKLPEEVQTFRGLPPALLRAIKNKLELTDRQRDLLDALILDSTPAQSFRKQFTRRKGTAGFSYDGQRAYANYFFHGASHIARVTHGPDLDAAIAEVEAEFAEFRNQRFVDTTKREQIVDFLKQHRNYILNPTNDWAWMRSVAFMYHIGFSVKSALVNFTQVPMVSYPYLSARFGDASALNQLRSATLEIHRLYKNNPRNFGAEFADALTLAIEQNFIDESQATELAAVAEGSNLQQSMAGNLLQRRLRQGAYWSAWMFQTVEKLNRRIVFRAAWNLARARPDSTYLNELVSANQEQVDELVRRGWNEQSIKGFLAGKDAVRRTQFEYASWARPRFMQGKKGVLFTFFMFVQNSLWFAQNSPGRSRYLLVLLATAGLLGMPGAEDMLALTKIFARKLGFDFDPEKEARSFLVEQGINNPDLILHGVSRYGFGLPALSDAMGLPLPSVDLSGSLGLGSIVPGVRESAGARDFESGIAGAAEGVAGAAFSIPLNVMKAMSDDHPDVFKRWERALPAALRNIVKAVRFYEEEGVSTRTGAKLLEFDINDPQQVAEIAAQSLGFTPTRVSQRWDRNRMQQEAFMYWNTRRQILFAQFDHARLINDKETLADIREAIKRFNRDKPQEVRAIAASDLRRSIEGRVRRRRLFERGIGSGQRRDAPLARSINRLFPEVEGQGATPPERGEIVDERTVR